MRRSVRTAARLLRYALRFCAFLVLLAVAVAAAFAAMIRAFITPENLRPILINQLQEAFHRPVEIQDVRFLLTQGIRVRGLRVLESPDFPGAEFLSSEVVLAKYNWLALLRRRLELNELRLVRPRIELVRRADGRWNIADVLARPEGGAAASPLAPGRLPVTLAVDEMEVDHGVVAVRDLLRRRAHEFREFNFWVEGFDSYRPFTFSGACENSSEFEGISIRTRSSWVGSASLGRMHWKDAYLSIEKFRGEAGGKTATASVRLEDFTAPRIKASIHVPRLSREVWTGFLPAVLKVPGESAASAKLGFHQLASWGVVVPASDWKIDLAPETTAEMRLSVWGRVGNPLSLRLQGVMHFSSSTARYRVTATLPQARLGPIGGLWQGGSRHGLDGDISGRLSVYGDLRDPAALWRIGDFSIQTRGAWGRFLERHRLMGIDGTLKGSDDMQNLSLAISRGAVEIYGEKFSELGIQAKVRQKDLEIEHLLAVWGASRVKLQGKIQGLDPSRAVVLDGTADRLKLDEAIASVSRIVSQIRPQSEPPRTGPWARVFRTSFPKTFPALSGRLEVGEVVYPNFQTFKLEGKWNLRGISTGLHKVNGSIRVGFGPGKVFDIPSLEKENKILRVVFLPFVFMHKLNNMTVISLNTAYPKTIDFNRIYGEYTLKQGVVGVDLFHVDSGPLLAYADGIVDFPAEQVQLHILTRLNRSRGSLPEYLTDQKGRPSIGFFVEGNLNHPDLRLEYRKMEEDAIENSLREALQKRRATQGGGT